MSRLTKARMAHEAARFFSTVMSPLLMPSYGVFLLLWISPLCLKPVGERFKLLLITLGVTCILPMMAIAVLHNFNVINNKRLDRRKERLVPYIFGTLCYVGAACYMAYVHEPQWVVMFLAGGALACAVSTVVNLWWKISAHSAGIAGLAALIWNLRAMHLEVVNSSTWFWLFLFTVLLCGVVGTSRLVLRRHTVGQVLAGWANGFLCVTLLIRMFG